MDVPADVEYDDVDTDRGQSLNPRYVPGVRVTCRRCQNQAEAVGTTAESIQRACERLMITCPRREQNNYYAPEA